MSKIVKEGLGKPMNPQLMRDMVSISNNSIITVNATRILSENLEGSDLRAIQEWISLVKREQNNNKNRNLGFGNPNIRRY